MVFKKTPALKILRLLPLKWQENMPSQRREVTIDDVKISLGWLCQIPLPGKPPQTDETKRIVAYLCRLGREKGVGALTLPQSIESEMRTHPPAPYYYQPPISPIGPLALMVKVDLLSRAGIDVTTTSQERFFVAGVPTTVVPLYRIMDRIPRSG